MDCAPTGPLLHEPRPRWERPRPGPRAEFTTTDPAEAHTYFRETYVDNAMRISGSTDGFRLRTTHQEAGGFGVSWMSHTMAVEHLAQPLGYVLIGRVMLGRVERETGGETLRAGNDDVFLIARPDEPYRVAWETMRLQLVRVELDGLTDDVDFACLQPVSPAAGQRLKRTINYACSAVLANPEALASPLIVAATTRLLGAAVLEAFGNRRTAEGSTGDTGASAAALRRAVAFVDRHAHHDIGLADIAAAARLAPRTVQAEFRRHLGTTPLGYLHRVRLERAHRDLATADPDSGETVAAVRLRWGFVNAQRFAAVYQRAYGVAPQETLQN